MRHISFDVKFLALMWKKILAFQGCNFIILISIGVLMKKVCHNREKKKSSMGPSQNEVEHRHNNTSFFAKFEQGELGRAM